MRHFCGKRDSVFGGQPRHAAEAVVGVVGGDGTLRRLGQPVVLVIGIGAACCPGVAVIRRPRPSAGTIFSLAGFFVLNCCFKVRKA